MARPPVFGSSSIVPPSSFPSSAYTPGAMLNYFKFRQDLFAPQPGRDVYVKRPAGKGWPEECPPIRAANAFGFDLLANFDLTFVRTRGRGAGGAAWRGGGGGGVPPALAVPRGG